MYFKGRLELSYYTSVGIDNLILIKPWLVSGWLELDYYILLYTGYHKPCTQSKAGKNFLF